jgi:hypothetical protein
MTLSEHWRSQRGGGKALVADHAAGEIVEDLCEGDQPWTIRYVQLAEVAVP